MKLGVLFILSSLLSLCYCLKHQRYTRFYLKSYGFHQLQQYCGGDLVSAVVEIVESFPTDELTIAFDNHTSNDFLQLLLEQLMGRKISVSVFNMTSLEGQEKYFEFLAHQVNKHFGMYSIFFCTHKLYEHLLLEIYDRNLIRRNLVYIFNWGRQNFERYFVRNIHDVMKVFVITNPRNDTFRLFYNQATSHRNHHLEMINWWNQGYGLFSHPTVRLKKPVFKDFKGKIFNVPVIHKPPWHFVRYDNDSVEVLGGRDDRILNVLAKKLNFRYRYFDPPERIQGSTPSENGTFKGVLGLIWRREADLFMGDVALTAERSNFVEFSFITLADSGAFITHAPSKLNEALALLRPFHWQVWPAIGLTFVIVGPVLYAIVALPNLWQPRRLIRSQTRLFFDCTWFTVTILLKQTGKEPSSSHKARFFIILLSISATYVINDMYSANLTSLLARPGREKAINNLHQLGDVMEQKGYNLFVERHSSSYSLLENGTGIYKKMWYIMNNRQAHFLVESVEQGVKLVKETKKNAVIAGRETLFFDIQRFGASNFHLSEKLNTAYSAIALQLGCPYIEEINRILMSIFEAGIITKMTENEYEKLGKQKRNNSETPDENLVNGGKIENRRANKVSGENEKLQPISLKMLQGTFYLLCIGNAFSGMVLVAEILFHKHHKNYHKTKKRRCVFLRKVKWFIVSRINRGQSWFKKIYRRMRHEAFVATLEYLE